MNPNQKKYVLDLWQKNKKPKVENLKNQENQEKQEIELYRVKINNLLKQNQIAKKAALIIESMLGIKKK